MDENILRIITIYANKHFDGHFTLMSFTSGYKFMFGTPDLDRRRPTTGF